MGQNQALTDEDGIKARLVEAARAMVLGGNGSFSISAICAEAGIERTAFRNYFPGRTALMAAVMQDAASGAQASGAQASDVATPVADAWLERRLRVFERALNALEVRAEASAREQARTIALLEEKLAAMGAGASAPISPAVIGPAVSMTPAAGESVPSTVRERPESGQPQPATEAQSSEPQAQDRPAPQVLPVGPQLVSISKEEMAEVLQSAREAARAAALPEEQPTGLAGRLRNRLGNIRLHWWAIAGLGLMALVIGAGMILGGVARARQSGDRPDAVSHRHVATDRLGRLTARADAGDARAQAALALAYARGDRVAADPTAALRWSASAARAGEPVAQYLLGVLYGHGDGVKADPARAFRYFSAAAVRGNLKAMHNLAIAYAEGLGTAKDPGRAASWFTLAAERGYVDSAFDLAVLYERGLGVPQDLKQAMKWYAVAGQAGDEPAKARVEFLRGQMTAADARAAADAARAFTPLPALAEANALPEF